VPPTSDNPDLADRRPQIQSPLDRRLADERHETSPSDPPNEPPTDYGAPWPRGGIRHEIEEVVEHVPNRPLDGAQGWSRWDSWLCEPIVLAIVSVALYYATAPSRRPRAELYSTTFWRRASDVQINVSDIRGNPFQRIRLTDHASCSGRRRSVLEAPWIELGYSPSACSVETGAPSTSSSEHRDHAEADASGALRLPTWKTAGAQRANRARGRSFPDAQRHRRAADPTAARRGPRHRRPGRDGPPEPRDDPFAALALGPVRHAGLALTGRSPPATACDSTLDGCRRGVRLSWRGGGARERTKQVHLDLEKPELALGSRA